MPKTEIKNRQNISLIIDYNFPEDNPRGLIFIEHGFTGHKDESQIKTIAAAFQNSGYTSITFDATNSTGESGESPEGTTFTGHYHDLEDVICWAKSQPWYQEPFVLAGHSLGGSAAIFYTQNHPQEVKLLIPFSPVIQGQDFYDSMAKTLKEKFTEWQNGGYYERKSGTTGKIIKVPFTFIENILKFDAYKLISKLTCPTVFINGDEDTYTLLSKTRAFYEELTGPKDLKIISGGNHIIHQPQHIEQLRKYIIEIIRTYA